MVNEEMKVLIENEANRHLENLEKYEFGSKEMGDAITDYEKLEKLALAREKQEQEAKDREIQHEIEKMKINNDLEMKKLDVEIEGTRAATALLQMLGSVFMFGVGEVGKQVLFGRMKSWARTDDYSVDRNIFSFFQRLSGK